MIAGDRVRLRPIDASDAVRVHAWSQDGDASRNMGWRYPRSRAFWQRHNDELAAAAGTRDGVFFAIETLDGAHIGQTHLFDVSKEDRSAQAGLWIGEASSRGRGFGRDALTALIRFGFDEMNLHRVFLQVWDDNEAAIRCYRRCGFVEEVRMRRDLYNRGAWHDVIVMGLLRSEFAAREGMA